jgi:hypothetical protein
MTREGHQEILRAAIADWLCQRCASSSIQPRPPLRLTPEERACVCWGGERTMGHDLHG